MKNPRALITFYEDNEDIHENGEPKWMNDLPWARKERFEEVFQTPFEFFIRRSGFAPDPTVGKCVVFPYIEGSSVALQRFLEQAPEILAGSLDCA